MDSLSKIIATEHDSKLMKQNSDPKIYHGEESFDLSKRGYVLTHFVSQKQVNYCVKHRYITT